MRTIHELLADVPQVGRIEWIGVRPAHRAAMRSLSEVETIGDRGLEGDIVAAGRGGGIRQVTLIQAEHLPVIAKLCKLAAEVTPQQVRRNLVVEGINLLALVRLRFAIGDAVVLVGTGPCAPCSKMDELVGPGGFQAIRGHGGITARVERGGTIRVGDAVRVLGRVADE